MNKPKHWYPNNIKALYGSKYPKEVVEKIEALLMEKASIEKEYFENYEQHYQKNLCIDYCLGCRRAMNIRVYIDSDVKEEERGTSTIEISPEWQDLCSQFIYDITTKKDE